MAAVWCTCFNALCGFCWCVALGYLKGGNDIALITCALALAGKPSAVLPATVLCTWCNNCSNLKQRVVSQCIVGRQCCNRISTCVFQKWVQSEVIRNELTL